jgi:choline dehydrogenase
MQGQYDHIVVGAGSAGCVLADRLTAAGRRVLLVEAGGSDRHLNVQTPAAFAKLFHTTRDWDLRTEPEPEANARRLYVPRGRMLGGSSSMNAMIYVRGRAEDYDRWRDRYGLTGWGWDDVLPLFREVEDNGRGADAWHGVGGPLRVEDPTHVSPLSERFVEACVQAGFDRTADVNGAAQDGATVVQVTQRSGRRWSAADAFLHPAASRPELSIARGAVVQRLLVEDGRAVGVEAWHRGATRTARADGDVILAAGAIGSPHLLLLSGIGPADHLRGHSIDVVADLPVGEGLQDHPFTAMQWETRSTDTLNDAEELRHVARYLARHDGKLASNVGEAIAFLPSSRDRTDPDLEYHFAPAHFQDHGATSFDGHSFTFGPALVTPRSRGRLWLHSSNPSTPPRFRPGTLEDPADLAALVDGVVLARELASQPALKEVTVGELNPGVDVAERDDVVAWVRGEVELLYHPTSTCRASGHDDGVVDPQFRVRGVDNLRVVDASVFPEVPRGNTNAPTIMLGTMASHLLLGD